MHTDTSTQAPTIDELLACWENCSAHAHKLERDFGSTLPTERARAEERAAYLAYRKARFHY